ncbi:MAG: hypothetical protein K2I42_02255, partial [Anaeroplasmataceae bacterium]|nr:hypothetical protein [Anaeroplasmataceae bacterium]
LTSFITFIGVIFFIGCSTNYKYYTNVIENYNSFNILDIFLNKGETKDLDFKEQFKNFNIDITKIIAKSSDESVFQVKGNTITAIGMGYATVEVEVYSKKESTCYYTTSANVYVIEESNKDLIEIYSAQDLANMNQNKKGFYILKNNIDLKEWGDWNPIGNLPTHKGENNSFSGMLINPDGYKISNLNIKTSKNLPQGVYGGCNGGLFGLLDHAYIDGVILENILIDLTDFDGELSSSAGGIAAQDLNRVIRNCSVEGVVISQDRSGGIVGGSSWGKILDCNFNGVVQSTIHAAGGIAGFGYIIKNCTVNAIVNGDFASGGILGFKTTEYLILDCVFSGELIGNGFKNENIGYIYS